MVPPTSKYPILYEINTRIWRQRFGAATRLLDIPDTYWQQLAALGVDYVWLMGVWQTGPNNLHYALDAGLQQAYQQALPDWQEADIVGSPYAIDHYVLHPDLGAAGDLVLLQAGRDRQRLARAAPPRHPDEPAPARGKPLRQGSVEQRFVLVVERAIDENRDVKCRRWPSRHVQPATLRTAASRSSLAIRLEVSAGLSTRCRRPPKRLVWPFLLITVTSWTSTLNSNSTAALISGLLASRRILNNTWLCFCAMDVAFSDTMGVTSALAGRRSASWGEAPLIEALFAGWATGVGRFWLMEHKFSEAGPPCYPPLASNPAAFTIPARIRG